MRGTPVIQHRLDARLLPQRAGGQFPNNEVLLEAVLDDRGTSLIRNCHCRDDRGTSLIRNCHYKACAAARPRGR